MKAISVRQPWAWLIVNGHKDIENRSWRTKYRGQVLIHAGQKLDMYDYLVAQTIATKLGITLPFPDDLQRGGIVGMVGITDCVEESQSPWFFGPKGFTLAGAVPLPFEPMKGRLSFFETGCWIENGELRGELQPYAGEDHP